MGETEKLIIEISTETANAIKDNAMFAKDIADNIKWDVTGAIVNGTPLDSNDSDYAEAQAYFAGMSYGWEQGQKDFAEKLKAEIEKDTREYVCDEFVDGLNHALEIIDKHISGEGDEDT